MAGDWIKLEMATPDKPEVVRMAAVLGIDQDAVFGKLFRVWAWADQNTVSGDAIKVTAAFLDRLTVCPGFANSMREAGWLEGTDFELSFPNFDRHNGATAKSRALDNRKKASQRQSRPCPENVPQATGQNEGQKGGPEKRREEKEETEKTRGAVASLDDVKKLASQFAVTSSTPTRPDDGFCEWWFEEQEKCGWTDPRSGHAWHDWRAAFRSAWRASTHRNQQRDSRSQPPRQSAGAPASEEWRKDWLPWLTEKGHDKGKFGDYQFAPDFLKTDFWRDRKSKKNGAPE